MQLINAAIVALLVVCAVMLAALYIQGARRNKRAEHTHQERRAQAFEATRAIIETLHLVGHALAAEVREASREQRNDLRLAIGLPRVSPLPRTWSTTPAASRSTTPATRDAETNSPPLPPPVPPPPLPSFESRTDDEPPPIGWTVTNGPEDLRK